MLPFHSDRSTNRVLRCAVTLLFLAAGLASSLRCEAAEKKPLKVFVLVGQSNMQGHAKIQTFEHIGMDPKTAPMLKDMQNADGTPRVFKDVWISYLSKDGVKKGNLTAGFGADSTKIGPELMFGITMQKRFGEPILIIKAAWGGKSLNTDFRPPSAGPYTFNKAQLEGLEKRGKDVKAIQTEKAKATGHYYRLTVEHVKNVLADISQVYPEYDAAQGYSLSGLVWFQGWNDMVDGGTYTDRGNKGGYDDYSKVMEHFIRDIRKDLSAPKLPVVIGVLGVGGPTDQYGPDQQRYKATHENFREAMTAPAALPEFKGNVAAVRTENYWDMELNALIARDNQVKKAAKKIQSSKKLDGKDAKALLSDLRSKEFTKRELEILAKGISNGGYHYLGSAKIMAGIGKGFADAMIELQTQ
ncbi:sialate O-acetylesterase [Oceaniferula spumae]|uniref:Sialate O-acetylesterase n=1 Tax=Oceaniferula spumae TaxID=2979115 RepID=A0AAT9FQT4_9BACT